jgi:hypothetical protein
VLNENKQIVAKPYDFEALKKYMDKNPVKVEEAKEKESKKEG